MDIVTRLRATATDKDNMPRMDSERWFPVGLAKEAADEIETLRLRLNSILEWHRNWDAPFHEEDEWVEDRRLAEAALNQ